MVVGLTCTEQRFTSIGDAVKLEIAQGLVEGHGVEKKGIVIRCACEFYEFETCEKVHLWQKEVRCTCVMNCKVCCVPCIALHTCRRPPPPPPRLA